MDRSEMESRNQKDTDGDDRDGKMLDSRVTLETTDQNQRPHPERMRRFLSVGYNPPREQPACISRKWTSMILRGGDASGRSRQPLGTWSCSHTAFLDGPHNSNPPKRCDVNAASHVCQPPDGGYGWVIVVCSLGMGIILGVHFISFAVLLLDFAELLNRPQADIATIASVNALAFTCVSK